MRFVVKHTYKRTKGHIGYSLQLSGPVYCGKHSALKRETKDVLKVIEIENNISVKL